MNAMQTPPGLPAMPRGNGGKKLWKWMALGVVALVVAVVVIAAVVTPGESTSNRSTLAVSDEAAVASGGTKAVSPSTLGQSGSTLPEITPKIIKTGKAGLELEKGAYQEKRADVYFIVESAGGYVQSESSSEQNGTVRGTLLLRVPFDRFDQAFTDLNQLGKVLSVEVASQDVTSEYVDLEGRIRHLESEEQFYLDLIAQAKTIQDMISIRERLDSVQLEKEQALGRKNYLDDQTSYSLITLNLTEKSDTAAAGSGFWDRVGEAFKSFGRACRELLVGLAYALPWLIILLILALLVWLAVKRRRGRISS